MQYKLFELLHTHIVFFCLKLRMFLARASRKKKKRDFSTKVRLLVIRLIESPLWKMLL
jgi:hypothetical protein